MTGVDGYTDTPNTKRVRHIRFEPVDCGDIWYTDDAVLRLRLRDVHGQWQVDDGLSLGFGETEEAALDAWISKRVRKYGSADPIARRAVHLISRGMIAAARAA